MGEDNDMDEKEGGGRGKKIITHTSTGVNPHLSRSICAALREYASSVEGSVS